MVLTLKDGSRLEMRSVPKFREIYDYMLEKIDQDESYTVRADGQIIGGMVVFDRGGGHYHLDLIYIDPAWHNRGIGGQALAFLEQILCGP
ncbi:MAG: GNAT family N-acetyltransferase [Synechococcaceae cyanobacterium SM2_3_60]|nr:GNAT family N-acetyltransferase [Synechococcaceae cyanobacterium SM2_3_60]